MTTCSGCGGEFAHRGPGRRRWCQACLPSTREIGRPEYQRRLRVLLSNTGDPADIQSRRDYDRAYRQALATLARRRRYEFASILRGELAAIRKEQTNVTERTERP